MRVKLLVILLAACALAAGLYFKGGWLLSALDVAMHGPYTVDQRIREYGDSVAVRLKPDFDKAGVPYPPEKITLVVLKHERELELYAPDAGGAYKYVRTYPILAASGHLGPKQKRGDAQVPEGIYGVDSLNPNSHYHLALHVDYPNSFDRAMAQTDGRTDLGGDIMIHGSHVSIGCVAVGDQGAEDLFVLAARAGPRNVRLLFCPVDFRVTRDNPEPDRLPAWAPQLYAPLAQALDALPLPPKTS